MTNTIHPGDALAVLRTQPAASVIAKKRTMCYNIYCLDEQRPGRFAFENVVNNAISFVGKAPLVSGHTSRCSSRQRRQTSKGRFDIMRDKLGRFKKGFRSSRNTEFKKGEHWRPRQDYWDREWLYNEYIVKQKSASEIAAEQGCKENNIHYFLNKFGIQTRSVSEARKIKHWGAAGEDNPMFGKRGKDVPNWRGGVTGERQAFYSSRDWKNAVKTVWKRDQARCQRCGKKAKKRSSFHIHHIKSFAIKEYRADVNNLILLCPDCHNWVHSKQNTKKAFIDD